MSGRSMLEGPRWQEAAWEPEAVLDGDVDDYLYKTEKLERSVRQLTAERDSVRKDLSELEMVHETTKVALADAERHGRNFDRYEAERQRFAEESRRLKGVIGRQEIEIDTLKIGNAETKARAEALIGRARSYQYFFATCVALLAASIFVLFYLAVTERHRLGQGMREISEIALAYKSDAASYRSALESARADLEAMKGELFVEALHAEIASLGGEIDALRGEVKDRDREIAARDARIEAFLAAERARNPIPDGVLRGTIRNYAQLQGVALAWSEYAADRYGWTPEQQSCHRRKIIDFIRIRERNNGGRGYGNMSTLIKLKGVLVDVAAYPCKINNGLRDYIDRTAYVDGNLIDQIRAAVR